MIQLSKKNLTLKIMAVNFIISTELAKSLDLYGYTLNLGYTKYLLNQPLNKELINIIIDLDFDPNGECEIVDLSATLKCLRNIPDDITSRQLDGFNEAVKKVTSMDYKGDYYDIPVSFYRSPTLVRKFFRLLEELSMNQDFGTRSKTEFIRGVCGLPMGVVPNCKATKKSIVMSIINNDSVDTVVNCLTMTGDHDIALDVIREHYPSINFITFLKLISNIRSPNNYCEFIYAAIKCFKDLPRIRDIHLGWKSQIIIMVCGVSGMFRQEADGNLTILNNAKSFLPELTPVVAGSTGREESELLFTLGTFL
jgi:hypothetical protein